MPIPQTAVEALVAWKAKQQLEAVRIGPAGANQAQWWTYVFDIIEAAPPGTKLTLQQFEAWCWNSKVGFPELAVPKGQPAAPGQTEAQTQAASATMARAQQDVMAQFGLRTEARVMAYSILREGWANVIARKRQTAPATICMVQKP